MQLLLSLFLPHAAPDAENHLGPECPILPRAEKTAPMIADAQVFYRDSWCGAKEARGADPLDFLFAPLDVTRAFELHGANCGPASLAALVGRNICEIMDLFPNFPEKPYTNIPRMHAALRKTGLAFRREAAGFPSDGLVLLQVEGPWTAPKRASYDAAYHRHWVSVRWDHIYEVNLESWVPRQVWEEDYLPALVARHDGATGWSVRTVFEIEEREAEKETKIPERRGTRLHALSATNGNPCRNRV